MSDQSQKKKIAIVGVSSAILVAVVVVVAVGFSGNGHHKAEESSAPSPPSGGISTTSKAIQSICQPTDYRQTCEESLTKEAGNTTDPQKLVQAGFKVTIEALKEAINNSATLKEIAKDPMASQALEVCEKLMDDSIADLQNSFDQLGSLDLSKFDQFVDDLKVWLSASITYQQSCIDAFENTTGNAGQKMKEILTTSTMLTSNGLAMVSGLSSIFKDLNLSGLISRRLLEEQEFPSWVSEDKRRLLKEATPETIRPDMTVAKDGSGDFDSIAQAVKYIPKNGKKTYVLYVKEGVYNERVVFGRALSHVLLMGAGPTKTKISGSLSYAGGVQTIKTATVTVSGPYFMAKDIGFENRAGAEGHQAVALRVQADFSVFYNCHIDGYEDTLYAHANRQFYRDCTISGTIDFIIGNARAVFQNCNMVVRKPLDDQHCTVMAQGRNSTREPTGFVLQNCTITADKAYYPVRFTNKAYLGRPYKEYSKAIVMQSQIDDLIDPKGWLTFFGSYGTNTCYFSEYQNRGAGANTSKRVTWTGIKKISAQEASDYTASKFLGGDSWITATGVPYNPGMIKV